MNDRMGNVLFVCLAVVLVLVVMLVGLALEYVRYRVFLSAFPNVRFSFVEWLWLFGHR